MEVKKKKNERKKALEEIKNKLKTEQLIANLRQLNEKSWQLASKRLTIAKHSKTSNLKNLGSMDKKILLTKYNEFNLFLASHLVMRIIKLKKK